MDFNKISPETEALFEEYTNSVSERDFIMEDFRTTEDVLQLTLLTQRANYIATRKLIVSVNDLNNSSTKLSRAMVYLSVIGVVVAIVGVIVAMHVHVCWILRYLHLKLSS